MALTKKWKKGSRSNGSGGNNCVEVMIEDGQVKVRDSKDKSGPVLTYTRAEWSAFIDGVKDGEFDLPEE